MRWREDILQPSQPYFVLDTRDFRQEVYLKKGVSHFYSFSLDDPRQLRAVPDGCIDVVFSYTADGMHAWASGTVLQYQETGISDVGDYFGVRFMPGVQPAILSITLRDIVGERVPLQDVITTPALIDRMAAQADFRQRVRTFMRTYSRAWSRSQNAGFSSKEELIWSVKQMVYESDGKVRVAELSESTGYSARYINKVFMEEMGFSPKTFCKILQFQRALIYLNYGAPGKMTDAATALGYYDQPQFIRDFKAYCGITPAKYLKMRKELGYADRISDVESDDEA